MTRFGYDEAVNRDVPAGIMFTGPEPTAVVASPSMAGT